MAWQPRAGHRLRAQRRCQGLPPPPPQILTWHEVVNDVVGGVPVVVTFCPLCNSAIVFDRTLDGVVHDFGVSGNLRNSDLVMWDWQTQSWWQQLTGDAIVGELTGKQLTFLPSPHHRLGGLQSRQSRGPGAFPGRRIPSPLRPEPLRGL